MENSFIEKEIAISDLILWDENARFPDDYKDLEELELIKYFLLKPEFEIGKFIFEIIHDFDLPQLEKLVVWDDGGNFVVLEGNRRLACYKILTDINLIKKINPTLHSKLLKEINDVGIDDDYKLGCVISNIKEDCFRYLDRKHNKGNNEVNWGDLERTNYSLRRGKSNSNDKLKIAISNFVKQIDFPKALIDQVLGKGFVTTFFRLTTSNAAKKTFGLNIGKENELTFEDKEFPEKIKVIIYNVIIKKDFQGNTVDSRKLNTADQIKQYLSSIKTEDVGKINKIISKNTDKDLFGNEEFNLPSGKNNIKMLPKTNSRKHLIPIDFRLTIKQQKINNIFRELREDLLLDDSLKAVPNAVGVLFRVFLEISLDYYAKKFAYYFKKEDTINIKINWTINKMKERGYDGKLFASIKKVASARGDKSYLSIDNFHEYVHSATIQPCSSELKAKWDNLQEFFRILWVDINKMEPK